MHFDLPVPPGYLSIAEAAQAAGVTTRTINRWLNSGLPHGRYQGRRYVNETDLARFLPARDRLASAGQDR